MWLVETKIVMGLRRVRDGFETHAMPLRLFCKDFCRTKMFYMFEIFANRLRLVCNSCIDIANPHEGLTTVFRLAREWNLSCQRNRKKISLPTSREKKLSLGFPTRSNTS